MEDVKEEALREMAEYAKPGELLWAVDDSELMIEGKPHTLLGAVSFHRPWAVLQGMHDLRRYLKLPDDFEFKWNSKIDSPEARKVVSDTFLRILSPSVGVLTVAEGRDHQKAAELLARQIVDFQEPNMVPMVLMDTGILKKPVAFRQFLNRSSDEQLRFLQFATVNSSLNDLVQCADLFAGFLALKVKLAVAMVKDPTITDDEGELPLSSVIEFSLRYVIWGARDEVPFNWDAETESPPPEFWMKRSKGLGLRIHSSVSEHVLEKIYLEAGSFYMGCLH